jgi:hypothetical protein
VKSALRGVRIPVAAAALFAATCSGGFALAEVVVLRGGTVVTLKQPVVRRGNTAYLTRADGTLLSVPVTEIDREATAAANQAAASAASAQAAPAEAPPASTPAEAARATADATNPKARVRITDADVSHPLEYTEEAKPEAAPAAAGGARVEVGDYTQEQRGDTLMIKGSLRNVGQGPAESIRMSVAAIDEKGQNIEGTTASLSKGSIAPGQSLDFTASMKVGEKTVATLRFNPQWAAPKPPPPPPGAAGAASAAGAQAAPPAPRPTPYGRGNLYAAPVANAPSEAPADGKTGYIPGAASSDQQPRPPSR